MTEQATETGADVQGWDGEKGAPAATYPQFPENPRNHRFTISLDNRGPMLVLRANTAQEINAAMQELNDADTTAALAGFYSHLKATMNVAQGLGPVTPVPGVQGAPAGPPALPQPPSPAAQQTAASYPTPPQPPQQGQQGPPPAWAAPATPPPPPAQQGPNEYQQAGWYKLDVPFPKKGEFDGICSQYGLRKGRPTEGGQYSFKNQAPKSWYCSPEVAGCFPQFSPVPA